MKTAFRIIKTALLCFLMFTAENAHSQLNFSNTYTTAQGQCVDLGIDTNVNGIRIDSFAILSPPANGQFILLGGLPNSWFYCPDSGFVGTDQALVYYCFIGGTFPVCDTGQFIFDVQPNNCNTLSVAIQNGPCAGPLPSLEAVVTGGTPPYQFQWSHGATSTVICNLTDTIYTVTVIDANGCSASTFQVVPGGGCQLSATLALDSINCSGQLGLTAVVTGGTQPYSYFWSDGGRTETTCGISPLITYSVTITDSSGCSVTASYNGSGCSLVTTIVQQGNCLMVAATGGTQPYTFLWNDNSTDSVICPGNPGNYCVTITDAQGCADVQCGTVGSGCQLTASIVVDSLNNCLTADVRGGTPPYTYYWSDNSMQTTLCGVNQLISYCVTVTDDSGCFVRVCREICRFSYSQVGSSTQPLIIFDAMFNQTGNTANVVWDFGDGATGSGSVFTKIYDTCNVVYAVTMTLADSLGNSLCTYTQPVYVNCFPDSSRYCQAYFNTYQDSTDNMTLHFIDQSVYNPAAYQWDFGDGDSDTLANPSHTYTTAGLYNVCLIVTDSTGCSSTSCQQVNAGNVQIQDLAIYHYHYITVTPGFSLWSNISYCNYGTTLMSGTVMYRYPAGTTFTSATPAPASHDATQRLLTFNFSNLLPGTCRSITVDLMVSQSLPLSTVVYDTAWVKPTAGDINPADNISTVTETVIGSWDPNDKAVSPKGVGDDGEIPVNTQTLAYKIRFQNTGTAPAVNVVVRDEMDGNIDLTSVRVLDASHEHITQIIGNELVVTFNNILLPDSNTNEPESHGYIQVVANLKPGLTEGTQISNTAEIYFDFNEPVITNTVVNTLKDATGIRQLAGFDFSILPNPAQEQILLSGKFSRNTQYEIINELGQILLGDDVTSDRMQVNIKDLKPGMYFVKIISNDKTGVQRLVVSR